MIKIDEKHSATIALRKTDAMLQGLEEKPQQKDAELQEKPVQFTRQQAALRSQSTIDYEAGQLLPTEGGTAMDSNAPVGAADIQRLEHELEVLTSAVEKQKKIVDHARSEFSVVVCDAQRADYIRIRKDIIAAFEKLAQANNAAQKFLAIFGTPA
jgi:hypothetical protein